MQDLIIVGAGAAGLSASLFASRYGLSHLIFGQAPGGQLLDAHQVENYPGFKSVSGSDLAALFCAQVEGYGTKIDKRRVISLRQKGPNFEVMLEDGFFAESRSLLLAMGAKHRALNVIGEEKFLGCGVSYSPTVDVKLAKDKVVAVVGGGDSACTGALALAAVAKKVFLIVRRDLLRAESSWIEKVQEAKNIKILYKNNVVEVGGSNQVEWVKLVNPVDGNTLLDISVLFITVGQIPAVDLVSSLGVRLDPEGYIEVDPNAQTNVTGVYAAGDLALQPGGVVFRQIITSAGEGARAISSIYHYLRGNLPAPNWS